MCRYCQHSDNKHEGHCPEINGKMAEWLAGYGAAQEGDTESEPLVDIVEGGQMVPRSDLTYGLGWAVGLLESIKVENHP